MAGRGRFVGDRITNSLRRRNAGDNRSPVNPFVKYALFFANLIILIAALAAVALSAYILVLKEKTISTFIGFIFDPSCLVCLVGSIAAFVAFFGCGGALRENICFLKVYYITLSILLLLEIILIILVFVFFYVPNAFSSIGFYPEDAFLDAIVDYREADDDVRAFIDDIQEKLSCCGASNDVEGYKDWNKNVFFSCNDTNVSPETCSVPYSCCKRNEGSTINYKCGANMLSPDTTDRSSIHVNGCLKGLDVFINDNIWIVGGVILGSLIPQCLFICFAKALRSQVEEQMMKW